MAATVPSSPMKNVLVRSLGSMVSIEQRRKARQFLLGLSIDELQYIAEFMGSCILESENPARWTRQQLSQGIQRFDGRRHPASDREHKMLLLLEFLYRCGVAPLSARAELT
jgi:hypothetical protein